MKKGMCPVLKIQCGSECALYSTFYGMCIILLKPEGVMKIIADRYKYFCNRAKKKVEEKEQ